jgi:hypothetical protein
LIKSLLPSICLLFASEVKSCALVQAINFQLVDLFLSLRLRSQTLQTNSHFTPEILKNGSGDLRMREWRELHNEELNGLYASPNIFRVIKSRRIRWAGHVARMGERRGVYRVLVGKPEAKRPRGIPRRR